MNENYYLTRGMPQYTGKPRVVAELVEIANYPANEYVKRYRIAGCEYGYLHNVTGGIATWRTYSGAYKALHRYLGR